jgi:hypothetical protein
LTTTAKTLETCKWYLYDGGIASPGNMVAKVYLATGEDQYRVPTGSPLATSDVVSSSVLTGSPTLITFTFSGVNKISISANTQYIITIEGPDYLFVGGHSGIVADRNGSFSPDNGINWFRYFTFSMANFIFYVYGSTTTLSPDRLPIGSEDEILTVKSGIPSWEALPAETDPDFNAWLIATPPAYPSDLTSLATKTEIYTGKKCGFSGDLAGLWSRGITTWQIPFTDIGYGITITSIVVQSSVADPTTELNANLKYCDDQGTGAFPGANDTLITAIDTTTGNYSSTGRTDSIATGKTLYVLIDADPVDIGNTWKVTVTYNIKQS